MTASTMETQGLVILEAIACGLPAVGVKSFAIPELIQEGKNGFNSEPFQPRALAELALKILNDRDLYRRFSEASMEIAQEHELGKCIDKMDDVYKAMLAYKNKPKKKTLMNFFLS